MQSIFLQDDRGLIIKPDDLIRILKHLKNAFPEMDGVTSNARSHTIARIHGDDLKRIVEAGLNGIHIGLESGADKVLKMVGKGVDKAAQIAAGRRSGEPLTCAGFSTNSDINDKKLTPGVPRGLRPGFKDPGVTAIAILFLTH